MRPDADIVIVGAGCAGLSLAAALGQARFAGQVLLLEPRTEYVRDRTWCFWDTEPQLFSSAISHSWSSWRVSAEGHEAVRHSRRYRYCHIPGDAFYRAALDQVARNPNQQVCLGRTVFAIERHRDGLLAVETSHGRVLARQVFDSRPPAVAAGTPALAQRFLGWHVRTAYGCFDPQTVELMQVQPSDTPGRIRFMYVLPFSSVESLVETTYLDDPRLPEPPYERDLQTWLRARTDDWEVLYTERGSLPMGLAPPAPALSGNVHAIGVRGGRIKPSSGYAFLRIQRHSRAIAEALREGRPVPDRAEPRLYSAMDAIFLQALRHVDASELFVRMFAQAEPDALVRFLSERSEGWAEVLCVAATLPKLPMASAAIRAVRDCSASVLRASEVRG